MGSKFPAWDVFLFMLGVCRKSYYSVLDGEVFIYSIKNELKETIKPTLTVNIPFYESNQWKHAGLGEQETDMRGFCFHCWFE